MFTPSSVCNANSHPLLKVLAEVSFALKIRVIPARDLSPAVAGAWSALQEADASLASPFFRPEFTATVASVRDDVFVGILERGGRSVGFFLFQRNDHGGGTPVGGR